MYLFAIKERGFYKGYTSIYIELRSSYKYWPENSYSFVLENIYIEVEIKYIQIE